jgi:hypothetical protein
MDLIGEMSLAQGHTTMRMQYSNTEVNKILVMDLAQS